MPMPVIYSDRMQTGGVKNTEGKMKKVLFTNSQFTIKIAQDEIELDKALKLRFEVFNLELNEGLAESYITMRDRDPFDDQCDHLIIVNNSNGDIVGTYRMQTKEMVDKGIGFYSNGEFKLDMLGEEVLGNAVELGRACIAKNYRNSKVLFMLWRGLAKYLILSGKRYLFGCSSLTSQDEGEGLVFHQWLSDNGYIDTNLDLLPQPGFELKADTLKGIPVPAVPPLMKVYLRYGVKVIGKPAIDREFKTIDYFVLLDLNTMEKEVFDSFSGD